MVRIVMKNARMDILVKIVCRCVNVSMENVIQPSKLPMNCIICTSSLIIFLFSGICKCDPGYTGILCDQKCPIGRHGVDCRNVCQHNSTCDPITGEINCQPGFYGPACSESCSNINRWGKNCSNECSCFNEGLCHTITGECQWYGWL